VGNLKLNFPRLSRRSRTFEVGKSPHNNTIIRRGSVENDPGAEAEPLRSSALNKVSVLVKPGNTKGGSITVPLTSCLTVGQLKSFVYDYVCGSLLGLAEVNHYKSISVQCTDIYRRVYLMSNVCTFRKCNLDKVFYQGKLKG
jgi:hypothetical protein